MDNYKLFKAIVKYRCKNKDDLIRFGFSSEDVDAFVNKGILDLSGDAKLTKQASFTLSGFAKKVFRLGMKDDAIKYLVYAYELDPSNLDSVLNLFYTYLFIDIEKAFYYFDILYHADLSNVKFTLITKNDLNFYLMMFSSFIKLSPEYKEIVSKLTFEDISYTNSDRDLAYLSNNIRGLMLVKNYSKSGSKIAELAADKDLTKTFDLSVIKAINFNIGNFNRQIKSEVGELINAGRYEEVYDLVGKLLDEYRLGAYFINVHKLLGIICGKVKVKETHETCANFYDALDKNNFIEARKLSVGGVIFNRLLDEIISNEYDEEELYNDLVDGLVNGNVDESLRLLNRYLVSISKSDYEDLIAALIKYNTHTGDVKHANVVLAINMLKNNDFRIDLNECYKEFYKRIKARDFKAARLLFEIIKEASMILHEEVDLNSLMIMLEDASKYDKYFRELSQKGVMSTIKNLSDEDVNGLLSEAGSRGVRAIVTSDGTVTLIKRNSINQKKREDVSKEFDECIKNGNYSKALSLAETIITTSGNTLFASLMVKYTNLLNLLGHKEEALEAYEVSLKLGKEQEMDYDFASLLASINEEEAKEEVRSDRLTISQIMNFDKDYEYLFDAVALKVSDESISVTEAASALGFDDFYTGMVLLIYAKRYYLEHQEKKGNEFMAKFNGLSGKDSKLSEIYESLRSMKGIYLNRQSAKTSMKLVKA